MPTGNSALPAKTPPSWAVSLASGSSEVPCRPPPICLAWLMIIRPAKAPQAYMAKSIQNFPVPSICVQLMPSAAPPPAFGVNPAGQ